MSASTESPAKSAGGTDDRDRLVELRRFHLGAPGARGPGTTTRSAAPRLLAPLRDAGPIRYDYPLVIGDPGGAGVISPLSVVLADTVDGFDPGGGARELRDNLVRLEHAVRQRADDADPPADLREATQAAAEALVTELGLSGESGDRFAADLRRLHDHLPETSRLVRYDDTAALRILCHVGRRRLRTRRAELAGKVTRLADRLEELLDVERRKGGSARAPDAVGRAVGHGGADLVDPSALASLLGPHRGTNVMGDDRRERIERAQNALRAWAPEAIPEVILIGANGVALPFDVTSTAENVADPVQTAVERFDRFAGQLAALFRAIRTAELELARVYEPAIHGAWLTQLDWESFSADELLQLPVVVVAVGANTLASGDIVDLLKLLFSGRPIMVVTTTVPSHDASMGADGPVGASRFDVASLAMGQRVAFVQQSTAARPAHLARGCERAVMAPRASLHALTARAAGTPETGFHAWLEAGASVEGRAHPLFVYDPDAGKTWAHRMDIGGNPSPEAIWSSDHGDGTGEPTTFTFADYALTDPSLASHFLPVPPEFTSDELVPIADLLAREVSDWSGQIPVIDAVSLDGNAVRLAVTRELAMATRERMTAWCSLRELGGVQNEYVARAVASAVTEIQTRATEEREAMEAAHARALEIATTSAASQAMQRLADALVSGGALPTLGAAYAPAAPASAVAGAQPAPEPDATAVEEPEAEPSPAAPAAPLAGPYIDSELCTTCGDCLVINPVMFVYDGNKQAIISDEEAGTFAELVLAAEACPAKCIHPGAPLDPSEANLEALVERARPFNPGA